VTVAFMRLAHAAFSTKRAVRRVRRRCNRLNVIEAKAHFDAPERRVSIRVGELDGRL